MAYCQTNLKRLRRGRSMHSSAILVRLIVGVLLMYIKLESEDVYVFDNFSV